MLSPVCENKVKKDDHNPSKQSVKHERWGWSMNCLSSGWQECQCQLLYPGLCAEVVCALQLQSWADTFASSSCNKSTSTRRQVLALFSEKERYESSFDKWQLNSTTSEEGVRWHFFYHAYIIARSNFLLRAVWLSVSPFRNSLEGPSIYSVTLPYQKKR